MVETVENVRSKTPRCKKFSDSSEMLNDALMHREGLTGKSYQSHLNPRFRLGIN